MNQLIKISGICMLILSFAGCKGSDANRSTDAEIETEVADSIASTDTLAVAHDSISADTIAADTLVGKKKDEVEPLRTKHKKTITLYEVEFCPTSVKNALERFININLWDDWRNLFEAFYLNFYSEGFTVDPYSRYIEYETDYDYSGIIGYARIDSILMLITDKSNGNFKNYILTNKNPIQFTLQWTVNRTGELLDDNTEREIIVDYGNLPPCNADSIETDSFPGFWSDYKQDYI